MELFESGQMYLETILKLKQKQGNVRSVDVVTEMGFAKSSVSEALKQLCASGYTEIAQGGYINLTPKGHLVAVKILERHHVLTEFLKKIGVSEETAETDACRVEHVISDETVDRIKIFIGN